MPRPKSNLSQTVFVRYNPPNPAVTHTLLTETFGEIGPVKKCSVIRDAKPHSAADQHDDDGRGDEGAGKREEEDDAKRTRGYGFVRFASPEDAIEAVSQLNGSYLHLDYGDRVKLHVERACDATAPGSKKGGDKKKGGATVRRDEQKGDDSEQQTDGSANAEQTQTDQYQVDEIMSKRKRTARVIIRNLAFSAKESHVKRTMEQHFGTVVDVHLPTVPGTDPNNNSGGKKKKVIMPRHRGFAFVTFENASMAQKAVEAGNVDIKGRTVAIDFSVSKFNHRRMAEQHHGEEGHEEEEEGVKEEEKDKDSDDDGDDDDDSTASSSNCSSSSSSEDQSDDDSGSSDSESDSESDEEDEAKSDQEDEEDQQRKQQQRPKPRNDPRRTLFVRNVPFDANRTDLFEIFRHYGRIESIHLVKDRDTGVGKGTAFVRYETEGSTKRALEAAGSSTNAGAFVGGGNELSGGEGLYLSGRRLLVDPAVDRDTASSLKVERDEDGKPLEKKVGKDRRNLYLSTEGRVASGTPEEPGPWEELPESDRLKRGKAHQEKSSKLRSPLFFVNPVRLSFRNLAKHVDESDLKKLAVEGIRAGLAAGLVTKDDIVAHWRASGEMTARDIVHKISEIEESGKFMIPSYDEDAGIKRHIPSVYIDRDFGGAGSAKVPKRDLPPSRGFGFVEFTHHAHALACLRELNNNPAYSAEYATGGKKATELKKRQRKGGKKGKKGGRSFDEEGEGGGADFVGDDGRVRIPRLIVEFTVENKAKAKQQADNRAHQLANAEKQRAANRAAKKERKMAEEADNEDKPKRKKKGRGALQREKKRKQREGGIIDTMESGGDAEPTKKARKVSHDDADVVEPEKPKIKKVKPPKKRKIDKEEQAFEKMVKSYKQAFAGGAGGDKEKGKKRKDSGEVASNPRESVTKKRWFD